VQSLTALGPQSPNVFFETPGNVSATLRASDLGNTPGDYGVSISLVMPTGLMGEDFVEGTGPNWNITIDAYPPPPSPPV
jgi:hypothetical protein